MRDPLVHVVWQVKGLQSVSSKLTKPNDLFVECHMGLSIESVRMKLQIR